MKWTTRTAWLIVAVSVALSGCAQLNLGNSNSSKTDSKKRSRTSGALFAKAHPPVADLPVPFGFELDEGRSRHWTVGSIRLVDHVYKGSADKFAVARFYRTQMPINRWQLVRDVFAQGEVTLNFDKGNERCEVEISESGWGDRLEIKVLLSSAGKIPSPGSNSGRTRTR